MLPEDISLTVKKWLRPLAVVLLIAILASTAASTAVADDGPADGVQARDGRLENLAAIDGRKPVAQGDRRCQIPGRHRGHLEANTQRRLIGPITQNPS